MPVEMIPEEELTAQMESMTAGEDTVVENDTPTKRVIRRSNAVTYVTDERGRKIGWRSLKPLEAMDLNEIAGQQSTNMGWMAYAMPAFSVVEIDGKPVKRPTNRIQLRALIAILGDEGIEALVSRFQEIAEGAEGSEFSGEELEAAKK